MGNDCNKCKNKDEEKETIDLRSGAPDSSGIDSRLSMIADQP